MDVTGTVANNLRTIREERKLSLDAMAKLTGVSKSMLGQIERGDVNPTITVLWKIANGLKLSFSALLEKPAEAMQVVKAGAHPPMVESNGAFLNYPCFVFDEHTRFETYRIEIAPGGALSADAHLSGTEEYVTVFAGSLRMTVNGEVCLLEKGDSLRFKADAPHRYENPGSEQALVSMVIYYAQ